MRIAVLGVGLIGGSIGLAARSRLDAEVAGFDPDPELLAKAGELDAVTVPQLRNVFLIAPGRVAHDPPRSTL